MAELLYQGHGSYRLISSDGLVIYVDPFAGVGYDRKADMVLVTHEHHDHNAVNLVAQKPGCMVLRAGDMLVDGEYRTVAMGNVQVQAVPAYNGHHAREECVGYLITIDRELVYAAGDTSYTDYMQELKKLHIAYALFPIDGIYNMDAREASRCAQALDARHSIPIHMKPGALFDRAIAEEFEAEGRIILEPGQVLAL